MKYRQKEGYVILIVFGIIDVLMILNTGITKEDIFSGRGWDIIAIEGMYIYFMIRFGIFNLRVIELKKKTCSVSLLGIKKVYKWEEIAVICYGVVHSNYRKNFGRLSEGIFFSVKDKEKRGKEYTLQSIFNSKDVLHCFYIIFDTSEQKEEILKTLKEWGIEVNKDKKLKMQEDYKALVDVRKKTREKRIRNSRDNKSDK